MQALKIRDLTKAYPNGTYALKGIDLSIESGDFFGFLGANGAGKSTTLGIITSLIKKTAGIVEVFGHNIDFEWTAAKLSMGLVPQEINFNIFEKCINILVDQAQYYGLSYTLAMESAEFMLVKLGLWNQKDMACMYLSGGMKRRLMIARALVPSVLKKPVKPNLLILDEPTAGVDLELRHMIWDFLRELNQSGTTILLTTHYLEEAEKLCNNIAIIDQGKIIENIPVRDLKSRIGRQTLICDLKDALECLPITEDFNMRLIHAYQIEVDLKSHQTVSQCFNYLQQHSIEVMNVNNKTNRLENFFLNLIHANHSE